MLHGADSVLCGTQFRSRAHRRRPARCKNALSRRCNNAFNRRVDLAHTRRQKRKSAAAADAVTLGDAWLAPAIQQGALQPVPTPERWRWWVRPR